MSDTTEIIMAIVLMGIMVLAICTPWIEDWFKGKGDED